jgi:hypothetical protein
MAKKVGAGAVPEVANGRVSGKKATIPLSLAGNQLIVSPSTNKQLHGLKAAPFHVNLPSNVIVDHLTS